MKQICRKCGIPLTNWYAGAGKGARWKHASGGAFPPQKQHEPEPVVVSDEEYRAIYARLYGRRRSK